MNKEDLIIGLINEVSKGNEDAFNQLYEITHRRVFKYLYRLTGNQQMAEDILIDTFTEIWRSAKKYKGHSKVFTWMLGIARNLAMNEFKKRKMNGYEVDDRTYSDSADQFHAFTETETSQILQEALNRLPIKHREILDLVFLQGMSYEDISQIINIPINTVKTRVFYAKEKLKSIINLMGIKRDDLI